MKRYAIVRGLYITAEKVAPYLPSNYRVVWSGKTDWHYHGLTRMWKQHPGVVDEVVVIEGVDDYGWTLNGYVIPRLASGLMRADECDLSHPIMKEVPA